MNHEKLTHSELEKIYKIKSVGGGTYRQGFFTALRWFHKQKQKEVAGLKEEIASLGHVRNPKRLSARQVIEIQYLIDKHLGGKE